MPGIRTGAFSLMRLQDGQRYNRRTSSTSNRRRHDRNDEGLCRWRMLGGTSGSALWGNGRDCDGRTSGGGKTPAFCEQESVCGDAHTCVMMKAAPLSAFVLVEPKLIFEFKKIVLDAPSHLQGLYQFLGKSAPTNRTIAASLGYFRTTPPLH